MLSSGRPETPSVTKAKCPTLITSAPQRRIRPSPSAIEYHWNLMSLQARKFILNRGHLNEVSDPRSISVSKLVNFWSNRENVNEINVYTRDACWYLAQAYIQAGAIDMAAALAINGTFIYECMTASIEVLLGKATLVSKLCMLLNVKISKHTTALEGLNSLADTKREIMSKLPTFLDCCNVMFSPEKLRSFIDRQLPPHVQEAMTSLTLTNIQLRGDRDCAAKESNKIKLCFLRVTSDGIRQHEYCTPDSSSLKVIFSAYTKTHLNGVSLKSLRFTFNKSEHDKIILFLSQLKKKTPKDFGMEDGALIIVEDITKPSLKSNGDFSENAAVDYNDAKLSHRSACLKPRQNGKKKHTPVKRNHYPITKTQEELKVEHSKRLTIVHEELQPCLKEIRQRLNRLHLKKRQPKIKSYERKIKNMPENPRPHFYETCSGGKAGTTYFVVNVGEGSNLYKTHPHRNSCSSTVSIDLHGLTKKVALETLDANLAQWIDLAMRGSYPFVQRVKIVCGGGNQVLSECVNRWIRRNKMHVAKAPKSCHL